MSEGEVCICQKSIRGAIVLLAGLVGQRVRDLFLYLKPKSSLKAHIPSAEESPSKTLIAAISSPSLAEWPETIVQKLTPEHYAMLVNSSIVMSGVDALNVLTRVKTILYGLQAEGVISHEHASIGEAVVCEFVASVKQHHKPDSLVKIDVLLGRVVGYAVKSCMTPNGIVKFERPPQESLH